MIASLASRSDPLVSDLRQAVARSTEPALLALAGLVVAVVVATGAPLALAAVALLPLALALLPVVLTSPRLAAGALVAAALSNANDVLAGLGVRGVELGMAVFAALALAIAIRRQEVVCAWTPVHTAAVLFLASRAVTIVWAQDPGVAVQGTLELARVLVFFVVVAALASTEGGIRAVVVAALATTAALAGLAIAQEVLIGNQFEFFGFSRVPKSADSGGFTARHSGPESDANFWGRTLVLFVPFAAAATMPHLRRWRAAAPSAAAGLLLVAGIYLTQSRGALLAAGLAGAVFLALAGRPYRRYLFLVPVVVVVALALPGVGSRLATLGQVGAASQQSGDGSLVSRFEVMRQGTQMFLEHPALGVGAHNFRLADAEYARRSGLLGVKPMAAHNAYLEMAAEGGIVGLAVWLLFLATPIFVASRACRNATGADRLAAAAVVSGLVGWMFASFFLHVSDLRPVLLLGAIAVVVDRRRTLPRSRMFRGPHFVAAAASVLALAGLGVTVAGNVERPWVATTAAVIRPERSDGEPSAYDLDVATRPVVGLSIAEVIRRSADTDGVPHGTVSARAVPGRGIVEVSATGATAAIARQRVEEALRSGDALLARVDPTWSLDAPFTTSVRRAYDVSFDRG